MSMRTTVIRIGNSNGLVIPSKLLKRLSISERDVLEIKECDGVIILRKAEAEPARTPFSPLDEWNEEHGCSEGTVEDALQYVDSLRQLRANGDIKVW